MTRSAWIKWARAVEHERVLARESREFIAAGNAHEYVRTDNAGDASDPLLKMHWRLKVQRPFPERWSVIIGDVLTNLRAALDHGFWAAVVAHSGFPQKPNRVMFPITTDARGFRKAESELRSLVSSEVWDLVEAVQPFHGGNEAHTAPLEILRWLSNVDKHRSVHIVGMTAFDFGEIVVRSPVPLEVIKEQRLEGRVEDGAVVARLKVKRPTDLSIWLSST